jgi:hypothetical protein
VREALGQRHHQRRGHRGRQQDVGQLPVRGVATRGEEGGFHRPACNGFRVEIGERRGGKVQMAPRTRRRSHE